MDSYYVSDADRRKLALAGAGLGALVTFGLVKGKAAKEAQVASAAISLLVALLAL